MPSTAPSTLDRPSVHTERRPSLTEKIWQTTSKFVDYRIGQARKSLQERGERPDTQAVIDTAYALQRRALSQADTDNMSTSELAAQRTTLLLLESPGAALASHTLKNRPTKEQSFEAKKALSLFNQDIAEALACMSPATRETFVHDFQASSQKILEEKWRAPTLSSSELRAKVNGVSYEVAVLRALRLPEASETLEVAPATVLEDLKGTDLIISSHDGNELRADVKTSGGFDKTLSEMTQKGQITSDDRDAAMEAGYFFRPGRTPEGHSAYVCVFDAEYHGGQMHNFEFKDPNQILEFMQERLQDQPQPALRGMGRTAIVA